MTVAAIIGLGSDIGRELALRYVADGCIVWGTCRNPSEQAHVLSPVRVAPCDLTCVRSVTAAVESFRREQLEWDVLIVAAGTEEPIGLFWDCDADAWEQGIQINALGPLRLVRALYSMRNKSAAPSVAFFSGAGTNNAAPNYSAYCASKIFLIKMCELLDAESPDTSFFIIGPGIVRTKIHNQTLRVPEKSGGNYRKVVEFLNSANPGIEHDQIYACLNWCIKAGKSAVGGRNISLVHDAWAGEGAALARHLERDANIYKLRRFGNELRIPVDDL